MTTQHRTGAAGTRQARPVQDRPRSGRPAEYRGRSAGTVPRSGSASRTGRPQAQARPRTQVRPQAQARSRTQAQTRRKKRKERQGYGWGTVIVLGLLLVLLLGVGAYRLWAQAPVPETPAPDTAQEGGVRPLVAGNRKKDFYTFLLVGRDTGGGGNTDTLMLAAYDVANQQASLMSIPRDTMVDVDWDVKKINSVYNHYKGEGDEAAADALRDAVAELVGFRPDFSVVVEWQAVGDLVEALGGVWFEVPFDMYYEDYTQGLIINQAAGYRLLNGADAMQVVRWRKNNCGVPNPPGTDGSDLGRTKLQQDFMAAALKQCLRPETVTRAGELAKVFTKNVRTGLSAGNLVWFAEQALLGGFSVENLYTCTMPNTPRDVYSDRYHTNLSYVLPRAEELAETVNDHFNPYVTRITPEQMNIMTVNADGSVSPSGGAVRK